MASEEAIVARWRDTIEKDCTKFLGWIPNLYEDLTGPSAICVELSIYARGPEIRVEGMSEDDARRPRVDAEVQAVLEGPTGVLVRAFERTLRGIYKLTSKGLFAVHRVEMYIDTQGQGKSALRFYARRVEGKMDEEENDE